MTPLCQVGCDRGIRPAPGDRGLGSQSCVVGEGGGSERSCERYYEITNTLCQPCTEFSWRRSNEESSMATSAGVSTASSDMDTDTAADACVFVDTDLGLADWGRQEAHGEPQQHKLELKSSFAQRLLPRLQGQLRQMCARHGHSLPDALMITNTPALYAKQRSAKEREANGTTEDAGGVGWFVDAVVCQERGLGAGISAGSPKLNSSFAQRLLASRNMRNRD